MKKNKALYIIVLALICILALAGCQTTARRPAPSKTSPNATPKSTRYTKSTPPSAKNNTARPARQNTTTPEPTPTSPGPSAPTKPNGPATPSVTSTRASNIVNNVNRVDGVNSSTVVISGNKALVGITQKANYPEKNIDKLNGNITRAVKSTDKGIKNVYLTTDAGLYKRIDNIARDVSGGKSLTSYTKEIADIIKNIGR